MKKSCLRSVVCICLLMAGMGTIVVSCNNDKDEKQAEPGNAAFNAEVVSNLGEFVSFIEDERGVMNHDAVDIAVNWWFVEVGENKRYYVIPKRGERQSELNSVSKPGTEVQFSGKLYNISEEFLSLKDHPDMKAAKYFADLSSKYELYYLVLPDMEDPDWQKCYIKQVP